MIWLIEQDSDEILKKQIPLSKQSKDKLIQTNAVLKQMKKQGNGNIKGVKRVEGIVDKAYGEDNKTKEKLKDQGIHLGDKNVNDITSLSVNKAKRIIHDSEKFTPQEKQMLSGVTRDLKIGLDRIRTSNKITSKFKPKLPKLPKPKNTKDQSIKPINAQDGSQIRMVAENVKKNLILTEDQILLLKEYHNQLHINFDNPDSDNPYDRPNYIHFLDFLEQIGTYGTLPQSNIKVSDIIKNYGNEKLINMFLCDGLFYDEIEDIFNDMYFDKYGTEPPIEIQGCFNDYFKIIPEFKDKLIREIYCNLNEYGFYYNVIKNNMDSTKIYIEREISIQKLLNTTGNYYDKLIEQYSHIGNSWCWAKGGAEAYCGRSFKDGTSHITLKGYVNVCDIDWDETLIRNMYSLNGEMEIFIDDNKTVEIFEITDISGNKFPLKKSILLKT